MFKVKSGLLGLSTNYYNSVYIPKQLQNVPFLEASFRTIFAPFLASWALGLWACAAEPGLGAHIQYDPTEVE